MLSQLCRTLTLLGILLSLVQGEASVISPGAVDTSRLMGSPEPLLPMQLVPAFPQLKFEKPLAFTYVPDGSNRVVVLTQNGVASIFENREDITRKDVHTFIDLRQKVLLKDFEEGLLGLAFHPQFRTNGEVFVFYSVDTIEPRGSVVSRFKVSAANPNQVDPASEEEVLRVSKPYGNHDGGSLEFGPDGMLYIAFGDGGLRDDPHGNGQNLETLLAKILRIDINRKDAGKNYAIPPDNPFANRGGKIRGEIWAYGVRNPWKLSFDPQTGKCWIGDVGQNLYEEIDIVERGKNYGWKLREGMHPFGPQGSGPKPELTEPIWEYPRTDGRSITGGVVYRGKRIPELEGAYLYADWVTGRVWALRWNDGKVSASQEIISSPLPGITSIGYDAHYEAHVTASDGNVYRFQKADWGPELTKAPQFPRKLSETGLFASVPKHQLQQGVVSYSVNVPLWSDGAQKERYVALPQSASVQFSESDPWSFPVGTVFVKTFSLEMTKGNSDSRRRLETRLLVHHKWGWKGYTYIWNEEQSEAELANAAVSRTFEIHTPEGVVKQNWYFPSRSDCNACHTPVAKFVLGANTRQLNRIHRDGDKSGNQIQHWADAGMFSVKPAMAPEKMEAFPDWTKHSDSSVDALARAYLDVNCAVCHVPGASGLSTINLAWQTPVEKMLLVGFPPGRGRTGPEDSRLVAIGDPERSELWHRMRSLTPSRMPPLASAVVDQQGVDVLQKWILGLSAAKAQAATSGVPVVWSASEGCNSPESAYYDADSGFIFVSQIAGDGAKKDGFGWITQLDLNGKVIKDKWVTGLSAPKGMRSHQGTLWVSDLNEIVAINIARGEITQRVSVPDAKFLNDLACGPDGSVYVADLIASKIYQYASGKLSVFAEGDEIDSPNGLLVEGGRLIVASWGLSSDFSTKTPGSVFSLDLGTRQKVLITPQPIGNLDGIESDGQGGYLVTDWLAGKVLQVAKSGATTTLLELTRGTADHAFLPEKKLLILPQMLENKVTAFNLSEKLSEPASQSTAPQPKWIASEGFEKPEGACYDPVSGFIFVSQISGEGAVKDGKGWITQIDLTGKVIAPKWVEGLNAPKGIRSVRGTLWVSDIDELVGIEITSGKILHRVKIEGAKFLNDVAADQTDGSVYVSDMLGNRIFRLLDGKVSLFAEGEQLEFPNGILVDGNQLIVAARGEMTKDLKVLKPGHLFALDLKTGQKRLIVEKPLGVLDGVESDGNRGYVISNWLTGAVSHVTENGDVKTLMELTKGTADLYYIPSKKLLLQPRMFENNLSAYDLTELLK